MGYLEIYDMLFKGFQKGKSTEHVILVLCSNIIQVIEKQGEPCTIFLNFSKAFDTVNHEILLAKLQYYEIRGTTLKWFESYLHNSQQFVKLNQDISDQKTISCGVPQGRVLGPLLFLISINDIYLSAPEISFHLFADDTCLFYANKSYSKLENILKCSLCILVNWLKAKKLTLNTNKSKFIAFNITKNDKGTAPIQICIDKSELEQKDHVKYLGVFFDKRLS